MVCAPDCSSLVGKGETMILVGIAGRAGSGKDTCADWLVQNRGAKKYSFAEPLKRLAMEVFGFSEEQCFGTQETKERVDQRVRVIDEAHERCMHEVGCRGMGVSPREMLIRLGDGARRWIHPEVWITACLAQIQREQPSMAVIADVRYPNEAYRIRSVGGYVIRLACTEAQSTVDRNASSEKSVDEIDKVHLAADLVLPRGVDGLIKAFTEALDLAVIKAKAKADALDIAVGR